MAIPTTAEDLQKEAANKETAYNTRKRAKLQKPNPATDKGRSNVRYIIAYSKQKCLCCSALMVLQQASSFNSLRRHLCQYTMQHGQFFEAVTPCDPEFHF